MVVRNENSRSNMAGIVVFGLMFLGTLFFFIILYPPHSLLDFAQAIVLGDGLLLGIVFCTRALSRRVALYLALPFSRKPERQEVRGA